MKRIRNPYGNTKKRKAALAWMAARGITQVRALYPRPVALPAVKATVIFAGRMKRLTSVS